MNRSLRRGNIPQSGRIWLRRNQHMQHLRVPTFQIVNPSVLRAKIEQLPLTRIHQQHLKLQAPEQLNGAPRTCRTALLYSLDQENGSDPNKEEQEKISNLGTMIERLHILVPTMVHKSLPKELLLPHILLRICPSHFELVNSYLPNIKGHVSYYATCKALQLFLTSLVLNPNVQLHVQSVRTSHLSEPQCVYPDATKVYVRWTTCPEGCTHLSEGDRERSTASAKLGSHRWARIDADKYLEQQPHNWSLSSSLADLTKGLIGLTKEEVRLERVILGVFIFELNEQNDQIIAHTIEDMDVVERREEQGVDGKLRVC